MELYFVFTYDKCTTNWKFIANAQQNARHRSISNGRLTMIEYTVNRSSGVWAVHDVH